MRPTFSAERIFGGTLLAMCSSDFICFYEWAECRLIRRIDVTVKVSAYMPDIYLLVSSSRVVYRLQFLKYFLGEIEDSILSGL